MGSRIDENALEALFRAARTYTGWLPKPVSDETLHELYDLVKMGPTSMNGSPARFFFLRSKEAKERLRPALSSGNVEKTMTAPVTAIIGYDTRFYEKLPKLFPHSPRARDSFADAPEMADVTARRNATLQGAYLIMAARALGLDCGPMSGFNNDRVDEEFFGAGRPVDGACEEYFPGRVKSGFLCNIGYGDPASLKPRLPRLSFDEACKIL